MNSYHILSLVLRSCQSSLGCEAILSLSLIISFDSGGGYDEDLSEGAVKHYPRRARRPAWLILCGLRLMSQKNKFDHRIHPHLLKNMGTVEIHGFLTYAQFVGDGLTGSAID